MSENSADVYIEIKQKRLDAKAAREEKEQLQETSESTEAQPSEVPVPPKASDLYKQEALNNFQIGEWQNENEVGLTGQLETVRTSQGLALFFNVQLNYRFGLKPKDDIMIWFAPRIGFDHNPIIISEEEIARKREGGQDAVDSNFEGEPFINYICTGSINSSI